MNKKFADHLTPTKLTTYCVAIVTLIVIVLVSNTISSAQTSADLINLSDLPSGAIALNETFKESDAPSHPLSSSTIAVSMNVASPDAIKSAQSFSSMRRFGALLQKEGVVVMNFAYDYANPKDAQSAVQLLQNEMTANPNVQSRETDRIKGFAGRVLWLTGNEGDSIYWLIGSRGKSLVLLMANGMSESMTKQVFDDALPKLMNK